MVATVAPAPHVDSRRHRNGFSSVLSSNGAQILNLILLIVGLGCADLIPLVGTARWTFDSRAGSEEEWVGQVAYAA